MLVEPIPIAPFDPLACLSEDQGLERCRFVTNPAAAAEMTERPRRRSGGLHGLLFLPVLDPVAVGRVVRYDLQHLTPGFVGSITESIEQALLLSGAIVPD